MRSPLSLARSLEMYFLKKITAALKIEPYPIIAGGPFILYQLEIMIFFWILVPT